MSVKDEMVIRLDPPRIMEYALGKKADNWQAEVLRKRPTQSLLLCSRQSGKSTTCAALVLFQAVFEPPSLVLIISKAFRQAEELFRTVKGGIINLIDKGVMNSGDIVRENMTTLELTNGSRIISLPGKEDSIRSYSSVSLLVIDEAAQVSDELYATVRPMIAISKGKIIGLTTPYGKRGWFFHAWSGDTDWYKVCVTAKECPRITKEFLDNERREVGEFWVKQEYFCEFVDTEDQLFSYEMIDGAVTDNEKSWH